MSAFLDTNVLLYLVSADAAKANRTEQLLTAACVTSVQVLNEFVAVARRKMTMTWPEIGEMVAILRQLCTVEPLTFDIHDQARGLAAAHRLAMVRRPGGVCSAAIGLYHAL